MKRTIQRQGRRTPWRPITHGKGSAAVGTPLLEAKNPARAERRPKTQESYQAQYPKIRAKVEKRHTIKDEPMNMASLKPASFYHPYDKIPVSGPVPTKVKAGQDKIAQKKVKKGLHKMNQFGKKVGKFIEHTGEGIEKVNKRIQPYLELATLENPELAPLLAVSGMISGSEALVDKVSDAYAAKKMGLGGDQGKKQMNKEVEHRRDYLEFDHPLNNFIPQGLSVGGGGGLPEQ